MMKLLAFLTLIILLLGPSGGVRGEEPSVIVDGSSITSVQMIPDQRPQCNERDNVIGLLGKKYQETVSALGVSNTGGLVEVLHDPKDGSWTIIITTPGGMSCLVAAGEGWRYLIEQAKTGPKV